MIENIINNFLSSAVEVFSVCCILKLLREDYQRKSWKIASIVIGLAAITAILNHLEIYINVGFNALLLALFIWTLYRFKFDEAVFDAICAMVIYLSLQTILLFLVGAIEESLVEDENFISVIMLSLVALSLGLYVISKFTKIFTHTQRIYVRYNIEFRWIFINLFIIQQVYMIEWDNSYFQFANLKPIFIICFSFIILTNIILMLLVTKSKKQKDETQRLKKLEELRENFLQEMASKQHEFVNHLQTIAGMCEENPSNNQIKVYIEEVLEKRKSGSKLLFTGDGAISGFLSRKKEEAINRGITFSSQVTKPMPNFPCANYELIEIMGNLLNNAFDAVENLNVKEVFLEIGNADEHPFLQVINGIPRDFAVDVNQMMQKGFSTKQGEVRGFGLYNINRLAEENNGELTIYINKGIIQIKILF